MPKVLIIAYWYPPKQTIGALRPAKWVKYLPDFGWDPVVITVSPRTDRYTKYGSLQEGPTAGRIYRTRDLSLNELLHSLSRRELPNHSATPQPTANPVTSTSLPSKLRRFAHRFAYAFYKSVLCFPDEAWP